MHRRLSTAAAAVLALWAVWAPATAYAAEELELRTVDTARFPELSATVVLPPTASGREVPPTAFSLLENGAAVTATVTRLPAEELEVVLVVDTSGSMAGDALAAAKQAAISFLGRMPASTRIGVVGFGEKPIVASPLSVDRRGLTAAVQALVARGETALYDALGMAVGQFSTGAGVRRSIVLLSDGGDTASTESLDGATVKLSAAGVRLDVVELPSSESNRVALNRLATAGKGTVTAAADARGLTGIYDTLARSLANQYLLSFKASAGGRTELRVVVRHEQVSAEGALVVDLPVLPTTVAPTPPGAGVRSTATGGRGALALGAGLFFAAIAVVGAFAFSPRQRPAGLARLGSAQLSGANDGALSGIAQRASTWAEQVLTRRGKRETLNEALERAGLAIRPGEFAVFVGCVAAVGLMLGTVLAGVFLGLLFAVLAVFGVRIAVNVRTSRRQVRFAEQLTDTLQLIAGSLRSGYALPQALDVVAREGDSPSSEEFRRLGVETRLGRELPEALQGVADRVGSEDFAWVVGAIEINREVGGNLAEVLDNVSGTIRERNQLHRQVRALSAEGRLSAYILVGLPFFVVLALTVINPGYASELFSGFGLVLCAIGAALMTLGMLWIKKICRLVF